MFLPQPKFVLHIMYNVYQATSYYDNITNVPAGFYIRCHLKDNEIVPMIFLWDIENYMSPPVCFVPLYVVKEFFPVRIGHGNRSTFHTHLWNHHSRTSPFSYFLLIFVGHFAIRTATPPPISIQEKLLGISKVQQ